jgi:hypothetical protein
VTSEKFPRPRECAVVDVLRILVVGEDLVGNARHEGMRDDHAFLVHDEDVGDAGDLDELVDDGLEGRIVLVDDQVDVRVGNAARDRPTVVQEIASQLSVHGVDVEGGGQRHNEPYHGEHAEQGLLIESGDLIASPKPPTHRRGTARTGRL